MQFAGFLPEDAPDPSLERWTAVRAFPVPLVGFTIQASLDLLGAPSTMAIGAVLTEVTLGYTLWRHPDDRADPRNLADLDDDAQRSLDATPPWPRPTWLIEAAKKFRYPMLWDAVRTHRAAPDQDVAESLRRHAAHILVNRFREELGLGIPPTPWPEISPAAVEHGVPVRLDGADVDGVRLDTEPFVYGVGADLGERGVFTAVLPRDDLPFIDVQFRSFPVGELAA